jgi:hypothetical protein
MPGRAMLCYCVRSSVHRAQEALNLHASLSFKMEMSSDCA